MVEEGGRLHVAMPLRWSDLDAFNHVNNVSMLALLEEARVRAFWRPDPGDDALPTAVLDRGPTSPTLTLVAGQEIEYLAPVPYQRRPLDIQLWFGRIGGSSVDVCYEVRSPTGSSQVVYARAATVVVKVDAVTGRPTRLTDEERAAWQPYLGERLEFRRRV